MSQTAAHLVDHVIPQLASTTSAHIRFDDHPNAQRFSSRIQTVTVDSVFDWLNRSGLGSAPVRVVL